MAKAIEDFNISAGRSSRGRQRWQSAAPERSRFRDTAKKLPIAEKTLRPIASITKSFTVTALGTLVDQGRLDGAVNTCPRFEWSIGGHGLDDATRPGDASERPAIPHHTKTPRLSDRRPTVLPDEAAPFVVADS